MKLPSIFLSIVPVLFLSSYSCNRLEKIAAPLSLLPTLQSSCQASQCHATSPLAQYPPASGLHSLHLQKLAPGEQTGICHNCHWNYSDHPHHRNGKMEGYDREEGQQRPGLIVIPGGILPASGKSVSLRYDPVTDDCTEISCHGGGAANWYNSEIRGCAGCHYKAIENRRQIFDSNGDGTGVGGDFTKQSHHLIDYADPSRQLVGNADCEICHDQTNHMSGSIHLKNKDLQGVVQVYDPADPSGIEGFCLSCHDSDGATTEASPFSPFPGGMNTLGIAPNISGIKIQESWDRTGGHRRQGLTCLGDGNPGTGCHGNFEGGVGEINAHGSGNKGLLANKMTYPISDSTWDQTRYALCLDCHSQSPSVLTIEELTGTGEGSNYAQYVNIPYIQDFMVTLFHDYATGMHSTNYQYPLHIYHLKINMWYYRGVNDPANRSYLSCNGCHNVHGTDGSYYLWDEWQFSLVTDAGTEYGKIENGVFQNLDYPAFCNITCHTDANYRYPRTPANEAKAIAEDHSGGSGLGNGDTVMLYFSNSTSGPLIDDNCPSATCIDTILSLSGGHTWLDGDCTLTATWSSSGSYLNNILTITICQAAGAGGDPTIQVSDKITFDGATITDTTINLNPFRGKMTLMGAF